MPRAPRTPARRPHTGGSLPGAFFAPRSAAARLVESAVSHNLYSAGGAPGRPPPSTPLLPRVADAPRLFSISPVLCICIVQSCCFVGVGGRPLRGLSAEGRLALRRPLRRGRCRVWVRQFLSRCHLCTCVVAPLLRLSGFRAAAPPCAPAPALCGAALFAPRCRRAALRLRLTPPPPCCALFGIGVPRRPSESLRCGVRSPWRARSATSSQTQPPESAVDALVQPFCRLSSSALR